MVYGIEYSVGYGMGQAVATAWGMAWDKALGFVWGMAIGIAQDEAWCLRGIEFDGEGEGDVEHPYHQTVEVSESSMRREESLVCGSSRLPGPPSHFKRALVTKPLAELLTGGLRGGGSRTYMSQKDAHNALVIVRCVGGGFFFQTSTKRPSGPNQVDPHTKKRGSIPPLPFFSGQGIHVPYPRGLKCEVNRCSNLILFNKSIPQ